MADIFDTSRYSDIIKSSGIYSREEIQQARYTKFARFGKILDPFTRLNNTTEYLFFVKPDLHIMDGASGRLNPELENEPFFVELLYRYPDVISQLQRSSRNDSQPFAQLLSFHVNSGLDLPSVSASTMDTPATIFGTAYEYRQDGESSDENHQFSLEFTDTKYLEVYMFFKAYEEYHKLKKYGSVTPPDIDKYIVGKVLHNVMGVFKFLVAEDMETIVYYAYAWGVMPLSVPREAFSSAEFDGGITFSVDFKAAFIDDMDPLILNDFNNLTAPLCNGKPDIPIYDIGIDEDTKEMNGKGRINGILPTTAYVAEDVAPTIDYNGKSKYKLKWR